ncbi:hypothetical protein [uncultured Endozoicomonas sp.]|uniref:hypothetical protein n=1 Tax=uncultured Endozoicomonas sp. TaxID=432652 RepID=UPI002618FBC3|nr:hypothetical protein [uncultured Endozoicomonas sp.]
MNFILTRSDNVCWLKLLIVLLGVGCIPQSVADNYFKKLEPGIITRTFNDLIRRSHPNYWGNFNLDPLIKPGAIGLIDRSSGVFQFSGEYLQNYEVITSPLSEVMKLSTEHVKESKLEANAQASNAEVGQAEVKASWTLKKKGAMVTRWVLTEKLHLKDAGRVIRGNLDLIRSLAESESMYDYSTGISQGFGVITGVIMGKGGMNIASLSDRSTFSISGGASSIRAMLSHASGDAAYNSIESEGNVLSFVWPAEELKSDAGLVPVAFTFASLDGEKVIMSWVKPITDFWFIFNNHGLHYVSINVDYTSAGSKHRVEEAVMPLSKREVSIPLDSTNVNLAMDYWRTGTTVQTYRWKTPLGTWPTGVRHIDIKGSWPMYPSFYIREEAFSSK